MALFLSSASPQPRPNGVPAPDDPVWGLVKAAVRDAGGSEIGGFIVNMPSGLGFRRIPNLGGYGEFWADPELVEAIAADEQRKGHQIRWFVHTHAADASPSTLDQHQAARSTWPWLITTASTDACSLVSNGAADDRS